MTSRNASISVIVNPVTGEEEAKRMREVFADQGLTPSWIETTEDDPGVGQAREAVDSGSQLVIACGGDGTVRACIESLAGSKTVLGIVPAGTGNLLAKNLGIPEDPEEALKVALGSNFRNIDVGYANGEAFAVMAGAGVDAEIMRDTPRETKETFGPFAYFATALRHLRDKPLRAVATADGGPVFAGKAATILAANFGRLQGGIDLAPDADSDDGRLDFVAVRAQSIASWLRAGLAILTRKRKTESVQRWSATSAEITFATPTRYELDGDERDATTHLKFTVQPLALRVSVPEEDK